VGLHRGARPGGGSRAAAGRTGRGLRIRARAVPGGREAARTCALTHLNEPGGRSPSLSRNVPGGARLPGTNVGNCAISRLIQVHFGRWSLDSPGRRSFPPAPGERMTEVQPHTSPADPSAPPTCVWSSEIPPATSSSSTRTTGSWPMRSGNSWSPAWQPGKRWCDRHARARFDPRGEAPSQRTGHVRLQGHGGATDDRRLWRPRPVHDRRGARLGRFLTEVGGAVARGIASSTSGRVRAYGEMVDLLWRRDQQTAAIQLEEFWGRWARSTRSRFSAPT